jgi:hypothetical protein
MAAALVLSESAGSGITLLTLNRAEKRNALSVELVQALLVALAVDMLGGAQAPLEALRLMLIASLVGLLIGLATIGRRLGQFVNLSKEGPKA